MSVCVLRIQVERQSSSSATVRRFHCAIKDNHQPYTFTPVSYLVQANYYKHAHTFEEE
jgi:hypothetical protein